MEHVFQEIEVADNGKIFLSVVTHREKNKDDGPNVYLYLLENPG
jgi:hypothetical protein